MTPNIEILIACRHLRHLVLYPLLMLGFVFLLDNLVA
jgi:hypothetical protein